MQIIAMRLTSLARCWSGCSPTGARCVVCYNTARASDQPLSDSLRDIHVRIAFFLLGVIVIIVPQVIANVMKGGHFVLVTGYDSADVDIVYVNDPGFNTTAYSISKDVVGWRIFDMLPVA